MKINIRKGIAADLHRTLALVKELAEYEKALHEVTNTEAMMLEDGFGKNPIFGFLVAEVGEIIVGISLYYYRYSTWKGKRLYLEDIIVTQTMRGHGIGDALFKATIAIARENKCTGMMWQVLDWNKTAIDFYKKYDTYFDDEWVNCHLDFK